MPVNTNLVDQLNYYTDNKVKIGRESTKNAVKSVLGVLDIILKYVNGKDERFSHQVNTSGSYASGLKVSKPDEFDYLVELKALPNFHWVPLKPRYYNISEDMGSPTTDSHNIVRTPGVALPSPPKEYHHVGLSNGATVLPIWHSDDVKFDGDLIPCKVKSLFKGMVQDAIRKCGLRESVRVLNKTHGPAITLKVTNGLPNGIHVDLVPFVPNNGLGLPPAVLEKWPRSQDWPPRHKVDEVRAAGIDSVAKDRLYWRKSFQRSEMILLEGIDKDGGCRKQCLRILKKLREDHWCRVTKSALCSYHLKMLLLWECEKYPDTQDWSHDKLGVRVMGLVQQLKKWIQNRRCPHYFMPEINLFEDKYGQLKDPEGRDFDFIEGELDKFIENPSSILLD